MCLLVSWVVIGPVILCWCLALQFRIKRDTQDLTRMVVHRSHFCIGSSCPSFVSMVTASTSLMTVASSCLCSDLSQYLEATTGLLPRINDHLGFRGQQGCPSSQLFFASLDFEVTRPWMMPDDCCVTAYTAAELPLLPASPKVQR